MVLFTDPKQVTNWLSPLEKAYDEERKQREKHHAQSKEVWKQEEAATFTADDLASGLNSLASFSKTLKTISTEREEAKQDQFGTIYDDFKIDDQTKIEQVAAENDLSIKGVDLVNKFRKAGVSEEAITSIEKHAGHKEIRLKRILGWNTLEKSIDTLDSEIESNQLQKDNFDEASRAGNVDSYYRQQIRAKLRKLGLSDKFIATHYEKAINKYSSAKGLEAKLDYKKVTYTQNNEERIKSFENLKSNPDPNVAGVEVQNLIKDSIAIDPVNGRKNAVILLHRLNKDGKINSEVIAAMKQGKIVSDLGKTGEKLLSEKDWKFIEQGEIEYQNEIIAKNEMALGAELVDARVKSLTGEMSNEELQQVLRRAKSAGLEDTDEYKAAEKVNPTRQNETVYTDERLSIEDALQSGNVEFLKQEKERVTNENLKAEIQAKIDHLEGKQKQFGYSEKPVTELVAKSLELTVGVDGNYQLPLGADTVNNDLIRYFRQQFNALSQDPNVLDPYEAAKAATQEYWVRNGGTAAKYRDGQPDTDLKNPRGKFTATHNGEFKLYDTYQKAKGARFTELNKVVNEQEFNQIKTNLITNLNKAGESTEVEGKTALERLLNTPEAILSGSELKAVFENNQVSQKILTQAKLLGVTPQEIIVAQFNALAKDDPNKALRNLDQSDIDNFVNPHLYIKEVLHKTKNTDLLYLLNREGIQNFSPKQATRLRKVLAAEAEVESTIDELNVEQKERDDERKAKELEFYKQQARIKENTKARTEADQTAIGTQEYFQGTDDRTDEELDEQFNAQPGLF